MENFIFRLVLSEVGRKLGSWELGFSHYLVEFQKQVTGYGLTTAQILYRRPDHAWLLQAYVWQATISAPNFPGSGLSGILTEIDRRCPAFGQGRRVRLHRALLQSEMTVLDAGLSQSNGVRNEFKIGLSCCQPNRQQSKSVQFRKETPWFSRRITVCNAPIATVQRRHGERKNSEKERKNLRNAKPSA